MANLEPIRLIITGTGPLGFGWQILIGDTPVQSSIGQDMSEAEANRRGVDALRNLGGA